ncbi:MAG: hypothetical protein JW891_11050, partial [Candidatus Lokiarchaeota archaeon]|nr:hypothetical protein [Candidatus Lokiarchaeota archaeon]
MFKTSKSVLWNDNGTLLCNATGHQEHVRITSDGQGGAIMCWQDGRTISQSIYAQRIDSNGNLQWGENGTILCKADDQQLTPEITSDGQGGAIVAWEDRRNSGITNYDIYAQRIDFNGELKWGENGTVICNKSTHQTNPKITSDGQGGAIIAWWDDIEEQVTGVDIIAQRVNSDGKLLWVPNGTVICNATGDQLDFQIISDNIGNFFISWQDQRTDNDIFAQKINLNGVVQWITNGTLICNALNAQNDPKLVSDGMGGSIITWFDARDGYSDVYAQRINSSGSIQWKANGTLLSNETGTQKYNDITSDGQGGAIIAWEDRKDTTDKDICAQKINSAGIIQWGENGTLICGADGDQESVKITSDGVGGAIIAWSDDRISNDIYAQKINFYGVLKWNDNGTVICNATNRQVLPEIICDGAGGAIIAWEDWRTSGSSDIDIYAQRIAEYPSIRINSPANNTVFNATAWQFNVSVSDGPIN